VAQLILKRQEAILGDDKQPIVIHRETDTDCVIMPDGTHTLSEFLVNFGVLRTVVVTGDASGMTSYNPSESGVVEIPVEVTDDSHGHSGATVHMTEGNRVVVSSEDKSLVVSVITANELSALAGINGSIQGQLNGKAAEDHNHDSTYLKQSSLGSVNGVVPLGPDGKISAKYLPSYVDDAVEGVASADLTSFTPNEWDEELHGPFILETGKIYSDTNTNLTYRWGGTKLIPIGGGGVELGETSDTAYRGDRGAAAYLHSQQTHARADATKTESSTTNGNILINGKQTVVYAHPSVTVTASTDSATVEWGGTFTAITDLSVNTTGHIIGKKTTTFTIPNMVNIQSGTTKPTNQTTGDLWFQDIS